MENSARDSIEWGERVLANRAGGKDLKPLDEEHQNVHRKNIEQHHRVLRKGLERMTQQLIFL